MGRTRRTRNLVRCSPNAERCYCPTCDTARCQHRHDRHYQPTRNNRGMGQINWSSFWSSNRLARPSHRREMHRVVANAFNSSIYYGSRPRSVFFWFQSAMDDQERSGSSFGRPCCWHHRFLDYLESHWRKILCHRPVQCKSHHVVRYQQHALERTNVRHL